MSWKDDYTNLKILSNGELAGIHRFMFTYGLVVGLTENGYRTRFCYETKEDAVDALSSWDGIGFPPGFWIKQKGEVEITNPLLSKK